MLNVRNRHAQSASRKRAAAPLGRPGAKGAYVPSTIKGPAAVMIAHPLTDVRENERLYAYEHSVKQAFDSIVPVLKKISAIQHEADFESRAQQIALQQLGFGLPGDLLADAWVDQLDMRRLFAWSVFETYLRFCHEVFTRDPLGSDHDGDFQNLLQQCGFHTLDISPCADGRLAHVIRYVLRLPHRSVRRRSYAGALFDIEDSMEKWVETELLRFREGRPNTADAPTRYLKAVIYHFSSVDPEHEGCAAHGSDTRRAARAGLDRLRAFQQAVQNTHCCGASIDRLLIGMDTDTDAIRVHVPDSSGDIDLDCYIDSRDVYTRTQALSAQQAAERIGDMVNSVGNGTAAGMVRFICHLLGNNISQIEYVQRHYGDHYSDIGHAERFIGAGIGFEEVQLRNLTYFAYLKTVEEAAADMDVGIRIFTRLNLSHGLPVPIVVRYDYHGNVPGARERAEEHCRRVVTALNARYPDLANRGLLHTLQVVRDINTGNGIEVLECSVNAHGSQEAH
jgi:carboxysome shell carbonic anhydrase